MDLALQSEQILTSLWLDLYFSRAMTYINTKSAESGNAAGSTVMLIFICRLTETQFNRWAGPI